MTKQLTKDSPFVQSYVESMLWSSNDETTPEGGNPIDDNYGPEDLTDDAWIIVLKDCTEFVNQCEELYEGAYKNLANYSDEEMAAHDFWLTRNGHGAGFWDGDWEEPQATQLEAACKGFGEQSPYLTGENDDDDREVDIFHG